MLNTSCPTCRERVRNITVVDGALGVIKILKIENRKKSETPDREEDPYPDEGDIPEHMKYHCEICGDGDEEDVQLVGCCGMDNTCDAVFHLTCLGYKRVPKRLGKLHSKRVEINYTQNE